MHVPRSLLFLPRFTDCVEFRGVQNASFREKFTAMAPEPGAE